MVSYVDLSAYAALVDHVVMRLLAGESPDDLRKEIEVLRSATVQAYGYEAPKCTYEFSCSRQATHMISWADRIHGLCCELHVKHYSKEDGDYVLPLRDLADVGTDWDLCGDDKRQKPPLQPRCEGCGGHGILDRIRVTFRTPPPEGPSAEWSRMNCHEVAYHKGEMICQGRAIQKKREEVVGFA